MLTWRLEQIRWLWYLLSARSDKEDRGKTASLTDEVSPPFSNEGDDCYRESAKLVQLWTPTTSDGEK